MLKPNRSAPGGPGNPACWTSSAAVVIGAMVIAMLLGPISGMGLALVDGNTCLLRKVSTAIVGGALADVRFSRSAGSVIVRALVRGHAPFSARQVAEMESTLPPALGQLRSELRVRYVRTTVMTGKGPLFTKDITTGYGQ